jgi:hypothetical protein
MTTQRDTVRSPVVTWINFAGVLGVIVGVYHVLGAIAALAKDDRVEQLGKLLYDVSITTWGWFLLIVGVLQILTGAWIIQRKEIGRWLGVLWAAIASTLTVLTIFVAPFWGVVVLSFELLILYALVVRWEEEY